MNYCIGQQLQLQFNLYLAWKHLYGTSVALKSKKKKNFFNLFCNQHNHHIVFLNYRYKIINWLELWISKDFLKSI